MNRYLLEIGVEELPSRFVDLAINQLKEKAEKALKENDLKFDDTEVYATPRRLALYINNLADRQEDISKEVRGPQIKIAFDQDGNPTKPLLGFMSSQNISLDQIEKREVKGNLYAFAKIEKKGLEARELLKSLIPQVIRDINLPRNMKWGGKNLRFPRPIRWAVSLFNDEIVEFPFEGIPVSNITKGHRFLGSDHIEIPSVDSYEKLLEENYVILNQKKREEIIKVESKKIARSLGGEIKENKKLLEELVYIVEYPTPLKGNIKEEFLILPKEVITTTMIDHLRYTPIYNSKGELLPYFITIRNGNKDYEDIVIEGNEKVLGARLSDAKFFYEDDTSKPLESYVPALEGVNFAAKLGNMSQKSKRNELLALKIGKSLEVAEEALNALKRTAYLSKADLTTKMVTEFTELQGVMGSIYAGLSGEKDIVKTAIFEQYLPRHAGDELPKTTVGSIYSIADKMDTIAGLFAIDLVPTGSQDPFALRRGAIGIINIIKENNWEISLEDIISSSLYNYVDTMNLTFDYIMVMNSILEFFKGRMKTMLEEENIRYDVIDSLISENDLIHIIFKKAKSIDKWFKDGDRSKFTESFTRINNLTSKEEEFANINPEIFKEDAERNLFNKFEEIKEELENLYSENKFSAYMDKLLGLCPYIDEFFEKVMVMDKDEKIKANRLALINEVQGAQRKILDISKIVLD
ncbi:glycine--tRNA ligase subunit beta [Peptoniphilus raoultii]|uniref:glycine--tRNA ligase subunit beta n=1 Tax=Peptoniphilus raoultii TaxID=1776387 RepID=UPI0008DADFBE|nr:glycine--tRNA ligase subunit beta [Peptoniphilus raoultii]